MFFRFPLYISILFLLTSNLFGQQTPEMVLIKGGSFVMGSENGEGDEKPIRTVTLREFHLSKYEVTVQEYRKFVESTNGLMPREPDWGWQENHPIINISWNDATAYIQWLNSELDEHFRLPTEAEFEFVMREGKNGSVYSWSSDSLINENIGDESFREQTTRAVWENYDDGFTFTSPVGSFKPNAFGVYDINGNAWEWVFDWYDHYPDEDEINPTGPSTGTHKVGRGASYASDPWHTRIAGRNWVLPEFEGPGFRLAKDINEE